MSKQTLLKRIIIVVIVIAVFVTGALLINYFANNTAPEDAQAGGFSKLDIALLRDREVDNVKKKGDTFTAYVFAINKDKQNAGEVRLTFDPTYWEVTNFTENSELLVLDKSIDNATGKLSLDVALPGPDDIPTQGTIATAVFTLKTDVPPASTRLTIDSTSTLGFPNQLKSANAFGSLTVNFSSAVKKDN
ncbi:MAG: hypothetical protein ABI721_00450 [Candidatus Dojkabacteria bacterium]